MLHFQLLAVPEKIPEQLVHLKLMLTTAWAEPGEGWRQVVQAQDPPCKISINYRFP